MTSATAPLLAADLDADALTGVLADIALDDDPADPRAALLRALFRADEIAAVHDPAGSGAMMRQALAPYGGVWAAGFVTGALEASGWGAAMGVQGLRWDPNGEPVAVQAVRAPTLPAAWGLLDAFALGQYRRILAPVRIPDASLGQDRLLVANLYVVR